MATLESYKEWGRGAINWRTRLRWKLLGPYYSISRAFRWQLSIPRLIFGLFRVLSSLLVAAMPVLMRFAYVTAAPSSNVQIPWDWVVLASIAIFLLLVFNKSYDYFLHRIPEQKRIFDQRKHLAVRLNKATAKLATGSLNGLDKTAKDKLIHDLLRCVLFEARLVIGHFDENYLEASLLLFEKDLTKIGVAYRAIGNRLDDSSKPAPETMAYYVARSRSHRVINSFKRDHPFDKQGLSSPIATYKSILLVPIIHRVSDGRYLCPGVVTIDSTRPYEFWGGRGDRIVIEMHAYLNLLRMLLDDVPILDVSESFGETNGSYRSRESTLVPRHPAA